MEKLLALCAFDLIRQMDTFGVTLKEYWKDYILNAIGIILTLR